MAIAASSSVVRPQELELEELIARYPADLVEFLLLAECDEGLHPAAELVLATVHVAGDTLAVAVTTATATAWAGHLAAAGATLELAA